MIYNYHVYPLGLRDNHTRGTIIYVNKTISVTPFNITSASSEVNYLVVKAAKGEDILVCCIYKSPNTNTVNVTKLFKLLKIISDYMAPHKIILRYFNYAKIDWHIWTTSESTYSGSFKFINKIMDIYMYREPTRIRGNQTQTSDTSYNSF